jgi:hypothetical protein
VSQILAGSIGFGLVCSKGLALAGAGAIIAADLGAIIFTPLLQRFPLVFNVIQGFLLCVAGDTLFQASQLLKVVSLGGAVNIKETVARSPR